MPEKVGNAEIWMIKNLALFLPWLWYAISAKSVILSNKVMRVLSGISLELYLAQMVIFRLIEKAGLLYKLGTGWMSFIAVWIATVAGLIVFIEIWKKCYGLIQKKLTIL